MRIAVGGFHLEASTYNPGLTRKADFNILVGEDLLRSAFFGFLQGFDAEFLPIFFARAVPGAPMERATYDGFKSEFLAGLRRLQPLDGVYLSMHGAAFVEGMEDAEGDFMVAVREVVGPDCPISVSYDLHGNVSQRVIDNIDMFTAYRTAPHTDTEATMRRAVTLLLRSIDSGTRPKLCWCPIPVVLQGERTVTTAEPARSLYGRLPGIETDPGIWDAALMVGYVWADEPRVTAAAIMTGTDRAAMERAASDLGAAYFSAREEFVFGSRTGSVEDCIRWASESPTHPVFLSDSGDNITAGGPGDRVDVLKAVLAAGFQDVIVAGIVDPPAVALAYAAGTGGMIEVSLGGALVPNGESPLRAEAQVEFLLEPGSPEGRQTVLRIGTAKVAVTAARKAFITVQDFARLKLDPTRSRLVVVKLGYLFPELAPLARPALMALSEGIVDQYVERLPRRSTKRPTYPFDKDFEFAPEVFWSARSRG